MAAIRFLKMAVLSLGFAFSSTAAFTQTDLNAAIAAGDLVTINAIVAANANNPSALATIANTLLSSAETASGANPTMGALLAAIAVNTGALTGLSATRALNMVAASPTALALLTNPNAPKTGGGAGGLSTNSLGLPSGPDRGIGNASNGTQAATNSAQATQGSTN